jgi:hypothetical protein
MLLYLIHVHVLHIPQYLIKIEAPYFWVLFFCIKEQNIWQTKIPIQNALYNLSIILILVYKSLHSRHRTKRGSVASALSHENDFTDCFEDSLLLEVLDMWNGERDLVFDSWTLPLPASLSCWAIEVLSGMSHALSCSACTLTEQGGVYQFGQCLFLFNHRLCEIIVTRTDNYYNIYFFNLLDLYHKHVKISFLRRQSTALSI